ncbi:MAG: LysE family transporter [Candidatus Altiarchaeota archaeon]
MDAPYLLALGFIVGLSGAMIPGPLLVYTIAESLRKGARTGVLVVAGHAIVEFAIIAVLFVGVTALMTSELFVKSVSILGGAFMMYTAYGLIKARWDLTGQNSAAKYGTITGGILFTALNPSMPVWWATAGARLLVEGIRNAGLPGALLVLIGHWGADLGWYALVSASVAKGREGMLGRYINPVKNLLALLLLAIGAYFIKTGV